MRIIDRMVEPKVQNDAVMDSKAFTFLIFDLEFRLCRTIKRDANLVGLRKIEYSSIKTKS
jgi:hypothetical protein